MLVTMKGGYPYITIMLDIETICFSFNVIQGTQRKH
jgi:hypothetical protein